MWQESSDVSNPTSLVCPQRKAWMSHPHPPTHPPTYNTGPNEPNSCSLTEFRAYRLSRPLALDTSWPLDEGSQGSQGCHPEAPWHHEKHLFGRDFPALAKMTTPVYNSQVGRDWIWHKKCMQNIAPFLALTHFSTGGSRFIRTDKIE